MSRTNHNHRVVAFLVDSEMTSAEFSTCHRKYTFANALDELLKVSHVGTRSGLV